MLLQWQKVLGKGTSKSIQQPEELQQIAQKLNLTHDAISLWFPILCTKFLKLPHPPSFFWLCGPSTAPEDWLARLLDEDRSPALPVQKIEIPTPIPVCFKETTRWLSVAALKETYSENPEALDECMQLMVSDLEIALRQGVEIHSHGSTMVLRLACTGIKGDWPFLIAAGHLERHFRRAPKQGGSDNLAGQGAGVCHLCCGGIDGIAYEDFSPQPQWEPSMQSAAAQVPWHSLGPFHALPASASCKPYLFRPDVFHNFHLGHGRYFVSSSLVLLQTHEAGGSVDARFAVLTSKWLAYCRKRKATQLEFHFLDGKIMVFIEACNLLHSAF